MTDLSLLACYAHPDDEQGATGTLRQCIEQGIRTALLCATRGEAGEISDPGLAVPETLGQVRELELRRALDVIGVPNLYFLDYRDSGMDGTPENRDPRAFINADPDEAIGRIVKVIRAFKPTLMLTFDESGIYGHPDHLAIHRWTTAAFEAAGDPSRYVEVGAPFRPARLYYQPIPRRVFQRMAAYMREAGIASVLNELPPDRFGLDDELVIHRIDVDSYLDLKRQSLAQHRTQNNPNSPFAKMPEETWREFRRFEYFAFAAGVPIPPDSDPGDLFAGLR